MCVSFFVCATIKKLPVISCFFSFERTRPAASMRPPCLVYLSTSNEARPRAPVLHRPQKKRYFADSLHKSTTGNTSTVYFSCTTLRRCATTSATLLIPKCTTRRWTPRCSNYSVAKRQQFSCALSTATLSLKFENVVPEGWI